jgi:chromosomal replication initiation ATPase DnaA
MGDFGSEILTEAEHRIKKFIPLKERAALAGRVIRKVCRKEAVSEEELRGGGQRRRVSQVRAKIASALARKYDMPLAGIAQQLGVCTSAIAKAVRKNE